MHKLIIHVTTFICILQTDSYMYPCKFLTITVTRTEGHYISFLISQLFIMSFIFFTDVGGTADITVQKVERDGKLSQLRKASGGSWGGNCVNNSFFQDLGKSLGEKVFQKFINTYPGDYFHLKNQFELAKRNLRNDQETVYLHIPSSLKKITKEFNGKKIGDIFNELETREKVYYSDGKLNYDSEYFKMFFSSSVQYIVDEVKRVLKSKRCS